MIISIVGLVASWIMGFMVLMVLVHLCGLIFWWRMKSTTLRDSIEHLRDLCKPKHNRFVKHDQHDFALYLCNDMLASPSQIDKDKLRQFVESKPHKNLRWLERLYHLGPTFSEIYPMLGILGTVTAIAVALNEQDAVSGTVGFHGVIGAFGLALDTTIWGLIFAAVFMVVHAFLDPRARVLTELHQKIDEILIKAGDETMQPDREQ